MPEAPVVIVGGGASGLSAAGALAHRGIESVILEQDAAVGDIWRQRYEGLRLHTIRGLSGLAHFPIPSKYPRYLSKEDVAAYLGEYARHFRLRVITGAPVSGIEADAGPWHVNLVDGSSWRARVVVVATGQFREAIRPMWPGIYEFRGLLAHSIDYSTPAPYVGLRVLVVGSGNSGAEIAATLSERGAARVSISIRTPPPIVPRDPFGMPVQGTSMLLSALPAALADRLGWATARLALGDLRPYGMPEGRFAPYRTQRVPLIDVGFVEALKHGRVTLRPALVRLTARGAVFADGTAEDVDAIIAATGFATGLGSLLDPAEAQELLNDAGEPLARSGDPTACAGLYFIGFTHSLRGHIFEANRASRRLARHIGRYLATPP